MEGTILVSLYIKLGHLTSPPCLPAPPWTGVGQRQDAEAGVVTVHQHDLSLPRGELYVRL